jgi:hypothetical protein
MRTAHWLHQEYLARAVEHLQRAKAILNAARQ